MERKKLLNGESSPSMPLPDQHPAMQDLINTIFPSFPRGMNFD